MTVGATYQDVLDFWFAPETKAKHFASDAALDQQITSRFNATYELAKAGKLADWEQQPESLLALIIVLDQFPRNMFRGTGEMFATDAQALRLTKQALAKGWEQHLPPEQQHFLLMPLMHSEELSDQDASVAHYRALGVDVALEFAIRHRDVIAEFGRYPHRNALLGRTSTPAEIAFLADTPQGF